MSAGALRVLGIDPGSTATGFGIVEVGRDGRMRALAYGAIRPPVKEFSSRLAGIYAGLERVIAEGGPAEVAIESIFHAENVRSALKLGHARGVALLCAAHAELPVAEYSPMEVKRAIVGYGRAEKDQVARMVGMLLGLGSEKTPHDATDALAVAICHVNASRIDRLRRTQGPAPARRAAGGPLAAPRKGAALP